MANTMHSLSLSLSLSANMLYKAALQEAGDIDEKEASVNVPHPYQVALGIVCLQQVGLATLYQSLIHSLYRSCLRVVQLVH